jgi:hypothetical protein
MFINKMNNQKTIIPEIETIPDKKPIVKPEKKPIINPERQLIPETWPDNVPLPKPKA